MAIVALAAGSAFAQQNTVTLTPEQKRLNNILLGVSQQRNAAMDSLVTIQAELIRLTSELEEANKKAEACKPEPKKEPK